MMQDEEEFSRLLNQSGTCRLESGGSEQSILTSETVFQFLNYPKILSILYKHRQETLHFIKTEIQQ